MTIEAKIAALPEWPELPHPLGDHAAYEIENGRCALARLALLVRMAKKGDVRLIRHDRLCNLSKPYPFSNSARKAREAAGCTCGRDALLAKMGPPK